MDIIQILYASGGDGLGSNGKAMQDLQFQLDNGSGSYETDQ